jgi:hypothetical protein
MYPGQAGERLAWCWRRKAITGPADAFRIIPTD